MKMIDTIRHILNPQCRDTSFLNSGKDILQAHSIKVYVKPWHGRHNVYGIFMLPNADSINYPIMLTVKGVGSYRKEAYMVKKNSEKYSTSSNGYDTLKVCLKTRVAIWVILHGLYNHLRNPFNWTISYTTSYSRKKD